MPAGGAIAACGLAPAAHADEYGLARDYGCTVTWHGSGPATMSTPSCIDAFLYEAHKDNLVSHPTDGQSSDIQLLSDALIACYHGPASRKGSADINVTAAAVRRIDSSLTGDKSVFSGREDVPVVDLAWIAVGTLCTGGVT